MVRVAELFEAEGRLLRAQGVRVGLSLALMLSAGIVLLAAIGFFMLAIFIWLDPLIGPAGASAICGALCLALAGALIGAGRSAAK